jgi:hypothetical protein
MLNDHPEHWTYSHDEWELKMLETPLPLSSCANINPYEVVLDEAVRIENMRIRALNQLVDECQDDDDTLSIYKSLRHLEMQMHLAHELARRELRHLDREEQKRKDFEREEYEKLRKQHKPKDEGLRKEVLLEQHEKYRKQEAVDSEHEQATENSNALLAESRRDEDYHPFDQVRERALRRILEERVKAKADEKEIREKMRNSSSNIVVFPEHVLRYQQKRKEQAEFEQAVDFEECERVKNVIKTSVQRKKDEKVAAAKSYQIGRSKVYPTTREYIEAMIIAEAEFDQQEEEQTPENIAQQVIPYREKLQEQNPRSRVLSNITEASHDDEDILVPDSDDFDLEDLPFEQPLQFYTPPCSPPLSYDEEPQPATAESVSLTKPNEPATVTNIKTTTPPAISPNALLMRLFERTISTKLSSIPDWTSLVKTLRGLSFVHIQKTPGDPEVQLNKLTEVGKYAEEHFMKLRKAREGDRDMGDAERVIKALAWVYKPGREAYWEERREGCFPGC